MKLLAGEDERSVGGAIVVNKGQPDVHVEDEGGSVHDDLEIVGENFVRYAVLRQFRKEMIAFLSVHMEEG